MRIIRIIIELGAMLGPNHLLRDQEIHFFFINVGKFHQAYKTTMDITRSPSVTRNARPRSLLLRMFSCEKVFDHIWKILMGWWGWDLFNMWHCWLMDSKPVLSAAKPCFLTFGFSMLPPRSASSSTSWSLVAKRTSRSPIHCGCGSTPDLQSANQKYVLPRLFRTTKHISKECSLPLRQLNSNFDSDMSWI